MKRAIWLWVAAVVITLASAVYQRKTGPTYPLDGEVDLDGSRIVYELGRAYAGEGDQPIVINEPDPLISGFLFWRRYKSNDKWSCIVLDRTGDDLVAELPHQPPAGKLEYHLELHKGEKMVLLPPDESVVTRFKGEVPATILIPHILFMFFGMLVSNRAGLEVLYSTEHVKLYTVWATALLFFGGMVLGPIVQKFAFGEFWTGVPFGFDLTDNKTLLAQIVWIVALLAVFSKRQARWWVLAASIITLAVFMIPHSLHGSELDYSKQVAMPQQGRN